jgi:hypothetical protein
MEITCISQSSFFACLAYRETGGQELQPRTMPKNEYVFHNTHFAAKSGKNHDTPAESVPIHRVPKVIPQQLVLKLLIFNPLDYDHAAVVSFPARTLDKGLLQHEPTGSSWNFQHKLLLDPPKVRPRCNLDPHFHHSASLPLCKGSPLYNRCTNPHPGWHA